MVDTNDFKPKITKVDKDNQKVYFEVDGVEFSKRLWYTKKIGYYFEIGKFRYNLDGEITKVHGVLELNNDKPKILNKKYKDIVW